MGSITGACRAVLGGVSCAASHDPAKVARRGSVASSSQVSAFTQQRSDDPALRSQAGFMPKKYHCVTSTSLSWVNPEPA